jgi:transcriptional regulator with XRE-family HTH domain
MVPLVTDIVNRLCQHADNRDYGCAVDALGKRVRQRRLALRKTQEEVAGEVGRSHSWLVALEHGDGNPPAEVLTALAVALAEDPREYLRPVARALAPVVERLDLLLAQRQGAR